LGKESVYVSDWYKELDETKQTADATTYAAACDIFKKRAQELENNPKFIRALGKQSEVRYDHPKQNKTDATNYNVIFRCLKPPHSKWGIVKGQKDEEDATTVDTIKREIFEEVGIPLMHLQSHVWTPMKFKVDNYNVYTWEVNPVEQSMIRRCIGERKEEKHGELFDMAFLPWEEVQNYTINDSNSKSLTAFEGFKTYLKTLPAAAEEEAPAAAEAALPKSRSSSRSSSSTKRKRSHSEDKTASIKGGRRNNKRRTRRKKRNRWIM
jgi:hypothetical protein